MRSEETRGHHRHHEGRRGGKFREERSEMKEGRATSGAKTFRRGRAIAFLEHLETKRDSLKKQLATPELQALNVQIAGELKATELIIDEFIKVFELQEAEPENKNE